MSKSSCEGDRGVSKAGRENGPSVQGQRSSLHSVSGHAWMSKPRTGSGVSMGKKTQHKVELDCCHEEAAGPLFFAMNTQALKQEENDECSERALGTADGPGYC